MVTSVTNQVQERKKSGEKWFFASFHFWCYTIHVNTKLRDVRHFFLTSLFLYRTNNGKIEPTLDLLSCQTVQSDHFAFVKPFKKKKKKNCRSVSSDSNDIVEQNSMWEEDSDRNKMTKVRLLGEWLINCQ